jgi:PAS domain S-box-containing protein
MRVIQSGDHSIGFVHLRLDQHLREEQILHRIYHGLGFGLLYLASTVLLLYLIVNTLTRQLGSLLETMKRVHDGDKTVRADEEGSNELSQLSCEFNSMLDSITLGEMRLKEIKERLEYAVNGTQDGLWDWDLKTNEVYFAPRWKEMLGYADDELPNTLDTWEKNVHPDDFEAAEAAVVFSQEKPGQFYENIHRVRHKNGSWIWILDRGQTIFDADGKPIRMVGFHTDITKQKELERAFLEQEEIMIAQSRHVAMGEMIGMIAHQWRQPITVIAMGANNMLVDIALDEMSGESVKHEAQDILKQTEYLSKTIDDFRNFFRPNKDKDEINVVDVLLEAKQIMGKSLENHNIELSIAEGNFVPVFTYSRELLQVFLNLLKNAKEALEEKKIENAYIKVTIEDIDDSLFINVCDNAGGIDEAIMGRIFEPYFTTKDKKTGTGLGLYMSKTIIEKHLHGLLTAMNTDEGACLRIRIPKEVKEENNHE